MFLIKSAFFCLDNLFFFFSFGFLNDNIEWIFLFIIDLKFFSCIKKIISDKLSDIGKKSQFRDFKECYDDSNNNDNNRYKYSDYFRTSFRKSIKSRQCKSDSQGKDKHLNDRNT